MSAVIFPVIRIYDPALDHTLTPQDAWDDFLRERKIDGLVFLDGKRPAVFRCRVLTLDERRAMRTGSTNADQNEMAFARGLLSVDDFTTQDGRVGPWLRANDATAKGRPISDGALAAFCENDIQEIGSVIRSRSFLGPDQPPFYPLPDTSLHALAALRRHRAALTSASSSSAPTKPEAAPPPPETPTG